MFDFSIYNNLVEDDKNQHSKYVEELKKSYGKEVIENKKIIKN